MFIYFSKDSLTVLQRFFKRMLQGFFQKSFWGFFYKFLHRFPQIHPNTRLEVPRVMILRGIKTKYFGPPSDIPLKRSSEISSKSLHENVQYIYFRKSSKNYIKGFFKNYFQNILRYSVKNSTSSFPRNFRDF